MIVSRYDPKWSVREDRLPDFAALVTTYGMEMFDDDGNPVLPAEAVAVTVEDLSCKIEDLEPDADVPLWTYKVLVERADGREELHTFYLMNQADPNNGIYDLWFDLSQVSREEAEAVRNTLVLGYDRTESPDGTRLLSIQPWGGLHALRHQRGVPCGAGTGQLQQRHVGRRRPLRSSLVS